MHLIISELISGRLLKLFDQFSGEWTTGDRGSTAAVCGLLCRTACDFMRLDGEDSQTHHLLSS